MDENYDFLLDLTRVIDQIKNQKRRLGSITRPYIMPEERTINIDDPRDLALAKFILENENN